MSKYTLRNKLGTELILNSYGARIMAISLPDKDGHVDDVVLGFKDIEAYIKAENEPYFGCVVGRFGNRISKGKFILDGKTYNLAVNGGENHIHGGLKGFDKVVWHLLKEDVATNAITFTYLSKDGEEGYPGNLDVTIRYQLTEANEIVITYNANTDKATPVNLTNHVYLNLGGEGKADILDHELLINANKFTPVGADLIPKGVLAEVSGSALDFTQVKAIGQDIDVDTEQLRFAGGYDHNYALNKNIEGEMSLAATVWHPSSGRFLEVLTEEPGVQFYSGNSLDGSLVGKSGQSYEARTGFCLETQHYPDSPNQAQFPNTILQPGEIYQTTTIYRFSVKE